MNPSLSAVTKKTLLIGVILGGLAFAAFFIFYVARVFLMIFAAVLIAVFLHGCSEWVRSRVKMPYAAGVVAVLLASLAFVVLSSWFIAPRLESELTALQLSIPDPIHQLTTAGGGGVRKLLGGAAGSLTDVAKLSSEFRTGQSTWS